MSFAHGDTKFLWFCCCLRLSRPSKHSQSHQMLLLHARGWRKDFTACLQEGWMEGCKTGKMEDEMSDASQSTILFFFLSTMGSFFPVMVLVIHSLIHSFTQSVSCVRGFVVLCVRSPLFQCSHALSVLFLLGILTSMLFLCNIFQWSQMSFPVFLSLSLSLLQTLIHTRTHTLWLTSACFASVSVSISILPPHRLSLFLYLSLCCSASAGWITFSPGKKSSQSETPTHPPSLCKLSFSQSPSISLFYSDSLCLEQCTDANYTHAVIEHLCFVIVFALDHSHALNPKQRCFKQPGDRLTDTMQKHTIQIMMLKGWQLRLWYLIKCGAQTYRCKMFEEGSRSAVVHYLSVRSGNNMGDAGTGGLCYITDWDFHQF